MKNNNFKKLICVVLLITVALTSVAVIASASGEIVSGGQSVATQYAYNSEFTVPSRYFTLNGENYSSKSTLSYPSGKKSTFAKAKLDEIGSYTLTYTADVLGTVKTESFGFTVSASPAGMWSTNAMVEATNNADVPLYNDKGAVLLGASERTEVKYSTPVYIGDNKEKDDLVTFVVAPVNKGFSEFRTFYIVIEDYENPDNRVYVRFTRGYHELVTQKYDIHVGVSTDGATYLGIDSTPYAGHKNAYILKNSGFYGTLSKGEDPMPITVSLNSKTSVIHVKCGSQSFSFDLTNENIVGVGNKWNGIDSGFANIYAGFRDRQSNSACYTAIYSVDGVSMAGDTINSDKAPSLVVDKSDYDGKVIAKKGVKHNFLKVNAIDTVLGELDVRPFVFKVEGDVLENVSHSYDGFTPTSAGKYYVEFVSEPNASGVSGISGYEVEVLEPSECAITFEFGAMVDTIKAGETLVIPNSDPVGGVGMVKVTYTAKIGNKDIPVIDNCELISEYTGNLVLTATCKDLVQEVTFTKDITVTENSEVYFDAGYISKVLLSGDTLDLTHVKAYKYGANGKENLPVEVKFDGASISNKLVKPTSAQAGSKQLELVAGGTTKTYDVTVRVPDKVNDYFSVENTGLTAEESFILASSYSQVVTTSDARIEFLRDYDKEFVSIDFGGANAEFNNFEKVTFYLYDTADAKNVVTFDIYKTEGAGTYSNLSYCGNLYSIYGNFNTSSLYFRVTYDSITNTIKDYKGDRIVKITKRADGKDFEGFTGKVRLAMEIKGVTAQTKINIHKILNQSIRKNAQNVGPNILFAQSFAEGMIDKEYVVPTVYAYDVLHGVKTVELVVKNAEGTEVFSSTDPTNFKFTITKEQGAGEYSLTFNVTDTKNKKTSQTVNVYVSENTADGFEIGGIGIPTGSTVAPTITLKSSVNTAKVNQAFNLAKLTLSDDKTALSELNIYAYVIAPNGIRTLLCSTPTKMTTGDELSPEVKLGMFTDDTKDYITYTATTAGKYRVYYVVRDADGLTSIAHYTVTVTE